MFFSGQPWDIMGKHSYLLEESQKGLYAFQCYDPYIEKIFLNKIPSHFYGESGRIVMEGSDVTLDWFKENIESLDFFSSDQSYLVLQGELVPKDTLDYIAKSEIDWGERYFLILFHTEAKVLALLKKKKDATVIKVEAARFWEGQKLLQFLCDQIRLSLPYNIQNYIVEAIPSEPGLLIQSLKKINQHLKEGGSLDLEIIKKIISVEKIDQFEMARLYGEKRWPLVFEKLLIHTSDYDGLMHIFRFLQGHLIKVADPSYIRKKSRPSKYDKNIETQSSLWKMSEVRSELSFLASCETLSKSKSSDLVNKLRMRLLNSYF